MTLHVAREQLAAAHQQARRLLLAEGRSQDHWTGELASSPLCTAAAISALVLAERNVDNTPDKGSALEQSWLSGQMIRTELSELITQSLRWLAEHQNEDGGWGDTDRSQSNIAATMMVLAAFHLTGVPARYADLMQRATQYVAVRGGAAALRKRFRGERLIPAAILANCALAGMIPWRKVPALPFELAGLPPTWLHRLGLASPGYRLPLLVAVGQARHHHLPRQRRWTNLWRRRFLERSLGTVARLQQTDGGFWESIFHTSLVTTCVASTGQSEHTVVRRGIEFLLSSVRGDGSWPLIHARPVTATATAVRALGWNLDSGDEEVPTTGPSPQAEAMLGWLLDAQAKEPHPTLGSPEGGWAWSTNPGAIPNSVDTAQVLLALAEWRRLWPRNLTARVTGAATHGVRWLLQQQNRDGGWPLFFPGWTKSPSATSATDTTALVSAALANWSKLLRQTAPSHPILERIERSLGLAARYLDQQQRPDGSWWPRWFGSEQRLAEMNPVIGTSLVLRVMQELQAGQPEAIQRAAQWLAGVQLPAGGWGAVSENPVQRSWYGRKRDLETLTTCSIEETSLAVEALLACETQNGRFQDACDAGLAWLIDALDGESPPEPAVVSFLFSKIWYYDRLLPLILAVRTLSSACRAVGVTSADAIAVRVDREPSRTQ